MQIKATIRYHLKSVRMTIIPSGPVANQRAPVPSLGPQTRTHMPQLRPGTAKYIYIFFKSTNNRTFLVVRNLTANAGDMSSIPCLGRFHLSRDN